MYKVNVLYIHSSIKSWRNGKQTKIRLSCKSCKKIRSLKNCEKSWARNASIRRSRWTHPQETARQKIKLCRVAKKGWGREPGCQHHQQDFVFKNFRNPSSSAERMAVSTRMKRRERWGVWDVRLGTKMREGRGWRLVKGAGGVERD